LAWAILACLPQDTEALFEPFAGSAAVSIAAAHFDMAKRFVLNDINAALVELWKKIIDEPQAIAAQYRVHWEAQRGNEKDYYFAIRNQFNTTSAPDCLLYLLARCVKAAVRYNADGEFNQSPDNRRKGAHPDTMKGHILRTSQLLKDKVRLSACDYSKAVEAVSAADVIYFDPPYQGVCKGRDPRYIESLSFDKFVDVLQALNRRSISYIVSYDGRTDSKAFGQRLPEWLDLEHIEVNAGRSTQATLLGRNSTTFESLYLSSALLKRLGSIPAVLQQNLAEQLPLL
jgi:DNA adenine methylase